MAKKKIENHNIIIDGNLSESKREETQRYVFDQAFRLYRKENKKADSWSVEAVKTFVKKRLKEIENTLENWFKVFKQY